MLLSDFSNYPREFRELLSEILKHCISDSANMHLNCDDFFIQLVSLQSLDFKLLWIYIYINFSKLIHKLVHI